MAPAAGRYLRPLLAVPRASTSAACAAQGLVPWQDPHNSDPAYTRVRVRQQVLPALAAALGPGVAEALARSASQLRADADVLESLAAAELARLRDGDGQLDAAGLADLPAAIRTRVLHLAAAGAGCPPGALTARHVASLDALVTSWHGQRGADLPGRVRGTRRYGKLIFTGPPGYARNAEDAGGRD
jgi:tRNA(Ile)-lysidine synthase